MEQLLFIVWRECIEALLVVGILHAWLVHAKVNTRTNLFFLWAGVAAGGLLATGVAFSMSKIQRDLLADAQPYFRVFILFIAAGLIVQMVFWMRLHGRTLKQSLHTQLSNRQSTSYQWRIFFLAMIAVAREGSEMVVFLYGISLSQYFGPHGVWVAGGLGVLLAYGTFLLLQLGGKIFSWRRFFQVTEILLLCVAANLMMRAVEMSWDLLLTTTDYFVGLSWASTVTDPAWNTSALITDYGIAGNLLSNLVGYRAQPTWCNVVTLCLYWTGIGIAWCCQLKNSVE